MSMLKLRFKGERSYIHGSDVYNAVSLVASELFDQGYVSSIAFKKFARGQCFLSFSQDSARGGVVASGSILAHGNVQHEFWLYETEELVTDRYPFDEEAIVCGATYDEFAKRICRAEGSGYTPVEDVIALTKRLNYLVCPEVEGKWVFSQLSLMAPLANSGSLAITMRSTLRGRFSVNDIVQAGVAIGTIRFVVGKP
jgi:hypothetical protein